MPWEELEETYAPQCSPKTGAPAKPARLVFGALFIRPQLSGYSSKAPFYPSMMVHFRKRFSEDDLNRINELVAERGKALVLEAVASLSDAASCEQISLDDFVKPVDWPRDKNWGTLTIDVSCTPVDITYSTDLKLLNVAGESAERIIGDLFDQHSVFRKYKPRYKRGRARAAFLNVAKKKKSRSRKIKSCHSSSARLLAEES